VDSNKQSNTTSNQNLSVLASKGSFWHVFNSLSTSVIRFISTAILARIIAPEDFGILGMAYIYLGLIRLVGNWGIGTAVVQKQADDNISLSTAFWAHLMINVILFVLSCLAAPVAALYFGEPILTYAIMALSASLIFSGIFGIHAIILYKDLQFKKIAIIELSCTIVRVITIIIFAIYGFKYWSLIIGILIENFVKTFIFFLVVPWKPSFQFDKNIFNILFDFGKKLYILDFLHYFRSKLDFMIVGRAYGASTLGIYQFAFNIPELINEHITSKIGNVLFPIYSKIKQDLELCQRVLIKSIKFISIITFPILFGLMLVADSFILLAYGEKWSAAIDPLRILILASVFESISLIFRNLLTALGRPDITYKFLFFQVPATLLALLVVLEWGVCGIAWAMTFGSFLSLFLIRYSNRLINMKLLPILLSFKPALTCSLIMTMFLLTLNHLFQFQNLSHLYQLIIKSSLGAICYFLCMYLLFQNDYRALYDFLVKIRNRPETDEK
jgi:O-antigen/teichoic acid export membrane protein